jgi:hypothetical protein
MGGRSVSRLKGVFISVKNDIITAVTALNEEEKRGGRSHYNQLLTSSDKTG